MSDPSEATVNIHPGRDLPHLETGLELLVIDKQGRESSWPVNRAVLQMGKASSRRSNDIFLDGPEITERQALLQVQGGKVTFLNVNGQVVSKKGETPISFCDFLPGEVIRLGDFRLSLISRREGLANLEGYTYPHRGRRWEVREGNTLIGRSGKRENHVLLEEITVSRAHATLARQGDRYTLTPDTDAVPTFVNGHKIEGPRALEDGDLIQLGVHILRFRRATGQVVARDLHEKTVTILFADIWNYAALSESRPLDELIRQMGDFYEMVQGVIQEHKGILTSYMGDSAVAIFANDEDVHPLLAVRAAMAIQAGMEELNEYWIPSGLPPFRIGVGVHTGAVELGDVSVQGKKELKAVGPEANLAAQIEKLTREYDARVLVSGATAAALGESFRSEPVGTLRAPGIEGSVDIFEVFES